MTHDLSLRFEGRHGRIDACSLFLDISGFTQMSEALAGHGSYGTEELTKILNSCFGSIIDSVSSLGGDIAGFGGDSLLAFFPVIDGRIRSALRRAVQCGLDVQHRMSDSVSTTKSAGEFAVRARAGACSGDIFWMIVGDPAIRLTCIVAGQSLEAAAVSAASGSSADVVVSRKDVANLGPAEWGQTAGTGKIVRTLPHRPTSPAKRSLPVHESFRLRPFVHPRIAELLAMGHTRFVNEHRRVTVMFIGFLWPRCDSDVAVTNKLQDYFFATSQIVQRHGGYLEQIETADKGSKYIVLFGAPVAREDNVLRALECALELNKSRDVRPRIGITTGHVYCGLVGTNLRREYVVIGDTVNLAARLMQRAAPQTILVDETTRNETSNFRWSRPEAIAVKGKRTTVTVARLHSKKPVSPLWERSYDLPFIGRTQELEQAGHLLRVVASGRGQIVHLTGEAGIGKSRLSNEILRAARALGFTTLGGTSRSYGATTGYAAWRPIIRGLLEMPLGRLQKSHVRGLEEKLATVNRSFAIRLPLLAPVIGVAMPDNQTTAGLGSELRAQSMKSLILDLLRHRTHPGPLALLLEDCQWLDQPSEDLMEFLGRNISDMPILLLVAMRVSQPGETSSPLLRLNNSAHIHLSGLSEVEAEQLVTSKLSSLGPIGAEALNDVSTAAVRGQGNPFYIEEIVNFLHSKEPALRSGATVPDTLASLILARLDALREQERTILKVASVIGRIFNPQWIAGAYPEAGTGTEILRHLASLESQDLTPKTSGENGGDYIFKHGLIQEVTYGTLTFDARSMLHERIGSFIEHRYPDELPSYTDELAHHYGHSDNVDKQRVYFPLAADLARSNFANKSAIDYYDRLLSLVLPEAKGKVLRNKGEVLQHIGRWEDAERAYRHALQIAEKTRSPADAAEAQAALGFLLSYTQSFDKALEWLDKAHRGFRESGDSKGVIRVLEYLSHTHFELGDYISAIHCATTQLQIATELDDDVGKSWALENLGRAHWYSGNQKLGLSYLHQALVVAQQTGNRKGVIHACNDVAGLYSELGDARKAMEFLERALRAANEIGYQLLTGITIGNAGHLYSGRGQHDLAFDCYIASLAIGLELSHISGILSVVGELGLLEFKVGQYDSAEKLFELLTTYGGEFVSPPFRCEAFLNWASCNAVLERMEKASRLLQQALTLASRPDCREYLLQCLLLQVELDIGLGVTSLAAVGEAMKRLLGDWDADDEQAAIHYLVWRLTSDEQSRKTAASIYLDLFRSTGLADYKQRFKDLTGETLVDPEPLPPIGIATAESPHDLETVLARISDLLSPHGVEALA